MTIGPNVTIRTGTSGGELGWGSQDLDMQGTIISELSGRKVRVLGGVATLTGSLQSGNGGSFELSLNSSSVLDAPVTVSPGGNLVISGNGWTKSINACYVAPSVTFDPAAPSGCDSVTITYSPGAGVLDDAAQVYIHVGYNDWLTDETDLGWGLRRA